MLWRKFGSRVETTSSAQKKRKTTKDNQLMLTQHDSMERKYDFYLFNINSNIRVIKKNLSKRQFKSP